MIRKTNRNKKIFLRRALKKMRAVFGFGTSRRSLWLSSRLKRRRPERVRKTSLRASRASRWLRAFREIKIKNFFPKKLTILAKLSSVRPSLEVTPKRGEAFSLIRKIKAVRPADFNFRGMKKFLLHPYARRAGVLALLLIFLAVNFFQNSSQTQGAQYTFSQTDWSGGVTANTAAHPTNENGWDEYSAGTNVVTTTAGQATLTETTHENFSETFTATTYKDATNTDANWNTATGQVEMASEAAGVNLYAKLNGFLGGNAIYAQVKAGNDYYIGAGGGKFVKYDSLTDTTTDLSDKIAAFWMTTQIYSLAFDSVNNVVYIGGNTGRFARYNTTAWTGSGTCTYDAVPYAANTACYLSEKISAFWSTNQVRALTLDSTNNVLYLAGQAGKFARYSTTAWTGSGTCTADSVPYAANTACNLTEKISAFWGGVNVAYALSLDSAKNVLYLAGAGGTFARYNTTAWTGSGTCTADSVPYAANTACNLNGKISAFWSTSDLSTLSLDSTGNVLYLGGASGKFARYSTTSWTGSGTCEADSVPYALDTACNLTVKVTGLWGVSQINSSTFDSANNVLYIGGASGKFGRYNTTSYPGGGTYSAANTVYDLTAKISGAEVFWSTNVVYGLSFDSTNGVIYLGGNSSKFARYNTTTYAAGGSYPTADTAYIISSVNGGGWVNNNVLASVAGNGNDLYIGGAGGKFAKYNTATGVVVDLSPKLSSFWTTPDISALAFDSANNVLYLGGASGKFARYNTTAWTGSGTCTWDSVPYAANTACSLQGKISGFWSVAVQNLAFDSVSKVVYLGGQSGKFARYNTTSYITDGGATYTSLDTAYDLSAKISGFWEGAYIYSMALDPTNKTLYLGGQSGKFGRYNLVSYTAGETDYSVADTAYSLVAKISAYVAVEDVRPLTMDVAHNVLYLGSSLGKFVRYNPPTYTGGGTYNGLDTAYDFTAKVSSFWSTNYFRGMAINPDNDTLFLGGGGGKFAKYSIVADAVTNLRSPDILSFWTATGINFLTMDSAGKLFIGGDIGKFGEKPPTPSTSSAYSSTLDAVAYNIVYATLTKNDTVGTGTIAYSLSNDGGATWEAVTPSVNHAFSSTGSDLRFKATVSGNATVQSLAIEYWSYNTTGELTSSKYNASDPANVLAKMAWSETLPAGTDLKFQLRTSADGNTWTAWCGPDDGVNGSCNSGIYFTDPAGTETVDDINNDHTDDQWFQYKAYLSTSDGINTPTLSDATATYVVNAPPQVQGVIASQGTDGLVVVDYEVLDPDTLTGVTPSTVNITLQYCTANCSTPGSETWTDAAALTGDYGAGVSVAQATWTAHQLVWTPVTDYADQYNVTDFKVRVKAADGELANSLGYDESANFPALDTSMPTVAADTLLINDSATSVQEETAALTLKLQNLTGDTASETLYAQFSKDGSTWYGANGDNTLAAAGSWGTGFALDTLATHSWPWTMTERSETIQVRVKDGYNNITTPDSNSAAFNATPFVQTVSATQGATGTVAVSYEIKDTDTAIGITPNALNVTLQYCTAACATPGGETWADASAPALSGNFGAGVATTADFVTKNLVWTPKTDYDEQYNVTDFKVRVKVDDGETFHNLDYAQSAQFDLDTKDPTNVSFTIDHPTNQLTITTPSDDSSYQMSVSNVAGTFSTFGAFASPYTYALMTNDPATVYIRIKDAFGNYTDATATTPAKPTNPIYFDISSTNQGTYQEFIAWDVVPLAQTGAGFASYKVYRKVDAGPFVLLTTITDRTLNYFLDRIKDTNDATIDSDPAFDPNNPSTYYYKITTVDTGDNVSEYSSTIEDVPNGAGGSDSTPPTISNVQVVNVNTTSAKVTWTTDELSDSSVGYSTQADCDNPNDEIVGCPYLPERGLASMTTSHEIVLTGLLPGSIYNIRIKSHDALGNLGQNDKDSPGSSPIPNFTFETHPGPAISQVTVPNISNHQATITWKTTTNSNTYVVYSDSVSAGALVAPEEVGIPTMVGGAAPYAHTQIISSFQNAELTANTTYYFYVKSIDGSNNVATDDNGGNFYQLLTTEDVVAPVLSGVNAAIINNEETAINWTTDEPATSIVSYGTESGVYTLTGEVLTYDSSHYVILSGLAANTDYFYTVTSADINTNESVSIEYSFTTLMSPEQQHDPLAAMTATIGGVEYDLTDAGSASVFTPAILTDVSAAIDFKTDQIAMCDIQYRKDGQAYSPADFLVEETGYNTNHAMHIMSLILNTKYYYKIECVDNLPVDQAGMVNSTEFSFTTLEQQYSTSEISSLTDSVAPVISSVSTQVNSGESVTVTWTTDEATSSYVKYGIVSGTYTDMAGDPVLNSDKTLYDTAHTVIVGGLIPGIKYFYTVLSSDAAGNIAESSEATFTTGTSSSLSSINITSAALGEALITWTTSEKTSSSVEYGPTNLYGQKKEDAAPVTAHSMTINGLTAAQLYHLRVGGKDASGQRYSSGDYTFTPKSPPQIGLVAIKDITEHGATISFTTDFPTDYSVTYTSLSDANDSGSKGKPDFSINHEVILTGLKPGTTYALKVKAADEQNNSVEKVAPNFTTGKDENAPEIKQTRTESALAQNDKVQTIISWETNELSKCSLLYREGATGEEREYKLSDRPTVSHVAVVTSFKSGTVYYFKIKSTDEAGNEALSSEYALLTPQKKENIVQIIVNNFQDIFSWTSQIGG